VEQADHYTFSSYSLVNIWKLISVRAVDRQNFGDHLTSISPLSIFCSYHIMLVWDGSKYTINDDEWDRQITFLCIANGWANGHHIIILHCRCTKWRILPNSTPPPL